MGGGGGGAGSSRSLQASNASHNSNSPPLCPYAVQRFIVRIIFMVPMYSICSFPSLIHPSQAIYWTTVRDW